jgi:hypothetical protein
MNTGLLVEEEDGFDASIYDMPNTGDFYADISAMAERLSVLKERMDSSEATFKHNKEEYELLKNVTIPQFCTLHGLSELKTTDGKVLTIEEKYACSPAKNAEARRIISQFLKDHNGEHLLHESVKCDIDACELLDMSGIQYEVETDLNTNSLKAWIKEVLGYKKGSIAQITEQELPKQFGFWKWQEANIK